MENCIKNGIFICILSAIVALSYGKKFMVGYEMMESQRDITQKKR
jgi:hypothetical protein